MDAAEPESDYFVSSMPFRARRALALIGASLVVIAGTAVFYVHPTLGAPGSGSPAPRTGTYRISELDFVDPSTGWVVADFASGDYAVLHTSDGGLSWTRQITGAGQGHAHYLKFFDSAVGVLGTIGTAPELYRTSDSGLTWAPVSVPKTRGAVLSWSFVDLYFGWALISGTSPTAPLPAYLYRTEDAGVSWVNLGLPAPAPDEAFSATFSYYTTGWLTSANAGPYAYRTGDFGDTWIKVPLPAPRGGWPTGGAFMVAVQPTAGSGVAASVSFIPTLRGRKGQGALIRDFPPLTVTAYDGGLPVTYMFQTAVGSRNLGPIPQTIAPNQTLLSTRDNGATWSPFAPPSASGAVGYSDAATWWWIGGGMQSLSRDGGATWSNPRAVAAFDPAQGTLQVVDANHAWLADAGTPAVLEATDDGGAHWRHVRLPPVQDLPTL